MTLLQRVISLIALTFLTACGAAPVTAPALQPKNLPLEIRITPSYGIPGSALRVVCRIPPEIENGLYLFAIDGVFSSQANIDRVQYERVITMPCEPITIYCGYTEYKTPHGWQKPVTISKVVSPTGECH